MGINLYFNIVNNSAHNHLSEIVNKEQAHCDYSLADYRSLGLYTGKEEKRTTWTITGPFLSMIRIGYNLSITLRHVTEHGRAFSLTTTLIFKLFFLFFKTLFSNEILTETTSLRTEYIQGLKQVALVSG